MPPRPPNTRLLLSPKDEYAAKAEVHHKMHTPAKTTATPLLSVAAVEQATPGHPGTPMALAPAAYVLWQRHLRFNPADPHWPERDRFVLSCGHASMLLYSLLHLTGYDLPMDELKNF